MTLIQELLATILAALAVGGAQAAPAEAAFKKAIWGPGEVNGQSQFPIYRDLGVDLWQASLTWAAVAPTRPATPTDPADPAYRWSPQIDAAVAEAARSGIQVSLTLTRTPGWANGNRGPAWTPADPEDFADFAVAAARRYPSVRHWMIWGEPSREGNFKPLNGRNPAGPRAYARLLDAAYGALKGVRRSNIVIGGNTWTVGVVPPVFWVRRMRLPNGRHPRLDWYGHNPYTRRKPRLSDPPLVNGFVDFGSLDEFTKELDRWYPKRPPLFLSEFNVPTGHDNWLFNFFKSERTAASWLTAALKESRRYRRVRALGWYTLYDEPPRPRGDETLYGLLDRDGRRKPAYRAYKRG